MFKKGEKISRSGWNTRNPRRPAPTRTTVQGRLKLLPPLFLQLALDGRRVGSVEAVLVVPHGAATRLFRSEFLDCSQIVVAGVFGLADRALVFASQTVEDFVRFLLPVSRECERG